MLLHGAVRRDGRVVAIDSRSWLVHRRELGAAYRTELAHELTGWGSRSSAAPAAAGATSRSTASPTELLDRWSSRHHQVQAAIDAAPRRPSRAALEQAHRRRRARRRAEAAAAASSAAGRGGQLARPRIGYMTTAHPQRQGSRSPPTRDLDRHWAQTPRHGRVSTRERSSGSRDQRDAAGRGERARSCWIALTEFDATFPDRDARAVALEASAGVPIDEALAALERAPRTRRGDRARRRTAHDPGASRARARDGRALAERLASRPRDPIPRGWSHERPSGSTRELRSPGGALSAEQRDAIALGLR